MREVCKHYEAHQAPPAKAARGELSIQKILSAHKRLAIVGGPGTGKTTLAARVDDRPVLHTDDTMEARWEHQPAIAIERASRHDSFVLEGVQAARAIRKGLAVDAVIIMEEPKVARTQGQAAMGKGCMKILAEALAANPGVKVYRESDL